MRPDSKFGKLKIVIRSWIHKFNRQALFKKIMILSGVLIFFVCMGFLSFFLSVRIGLFGTIPHSETLKKISHPLASEVFSADSVLIGRYFILDRTPTPVTQISPWVIDALISTEDVRFYNHRGVDYRSIGRVFFKSVILRQAAGGGSTLSQQLAKNIFPRRDHSFLTTPVNKIKEIIVARRLERIYKKEEILALYLNTVPFGDNTFGIAAASERFFNKNPEQLNPQEAAVLIGMLKGTNLYNPRIFPEHAITRRNTVLRQMHVYGSFPEPVLDSLLTTAIDLQYTIRDHQHGLAPYFREHLRQELLAWCKANNHQDGTAYNLYTDGLKIYTTIDSRMQEYAEEAVRKHMKHVQSGFDQQWGASKPWERNPEILRSAIQKSDRYRTLKTGGLSVEAIMEAMNVPQKIKVFSWDEGPVKMVSPIDSIKRHLEILHAGTLAIDPYSGAIKLWVGGIDSRYFQYDHASPNTRRQVGSTFKPIVYAAALEQGWDPCEYVPAKKILYQNQKGWAPSNTHEDYDLKYSMEGALAASVNTVSVQILEEAGISNAVNLARKLGIESNIPHVPSIALGTPSISLMEMTRAYAAFANEGLLVIPHYITTITDSDGTVLEQFNAEQPIRVIKPGTARLINRMLQSVVERGTGSALRWKYNLKGPLAGKTGTTQSNADGWFIGISPNLVMTTWVGASDPRVHFKTTALGQGSETALPIFAYTMQKIEQDKTFLKKSGFAPLTNNEKLMLDCVPFKEDITFLEKIFGKKEQSIEEKNFGEKEEKSFFRKLFKRKKNKN